MSLFPTDVVLPPGQPLWATLVVTPPLGAKLGTRDVHRRCRSDRPDRAGAAIDRRLPQTRLASGDFARARDPIYAESEITIEPYPPLAGEPTRICVELTNQSDQPREVDVLFQLSEPAGHRPALQPDRSTASDDPAAQHAQSLHDVDSTAGPDISVSRSSCMIRRASTWIKSASAIWT